MENDIWNKVIFENNFTFKNLYDSAPKKIRRKIDRMTDEELEKFIIAHRKIWSEEIKFVTMIDWDKIIRFGDKK